MKPKKCRCITTLEKRLAEDGLRLASLIQIDFDKGKAIERKPLIATEWTNEKKRKQPPKVLCQYCPICGVQL